MFDKALGEPNFSGIYARLCYDLNQVLPSFKVMDEDGKEEDVEFRRVLLNKCQSEFEEGGAAMRAVEAREKRQQEEDAAKVRSRLLWQLIAGLDPHQLACSAESFVSCSICSWSLDEAQGNTL